MALGTPTLATPTVFATTTSVATAAFTPTAGALLVVPVGVRSTSLPGLPTISDTGGLSYTPLVDGLYDTGAGTRFRARAWAAVVGGSPGSMTVTSASTSGGRMGISIVQVTGFGGLPANSAAKEHINGDPTIVLGSAPAASSLVLAFLGGVSAASGVSPPAGFTEIDDVTDGLGIASHICYDMVSAPTSIAYVSSYGQSVGIAVEVSEASGGGLRLRRRGTRFQHLLVR